MIDLITEHWDKVVAGIGAVAAFFAGRKQKQIAIKKSKAELEGVEVKGVAQNVELYQALIDDLSKRFQSRVDELEDDLERIKSLNEELRKAISDQEVYIKKLKRKIQEYEELEEQD